MKTIFKFLGAILVVVIVVGAFTLYSQRGRISLYLNIMREYKYILENPPAIDTMNTLDTMSSVDHKDIEYKNVDGKPLTLDIYGPRQKLKGGSPVIVYVHGGSWVYGNKDIPEFISPILDSFRKQGFTIISVSYELMNGKEIFSKQISDVKDSIRWIYKNKEEYRFNTKEIGVIGMSSGAHLSLMSTYTTDDEFKGDPNLSDYPAKIKYLVDFFGPTDLNTLNLSKATWDLKQILKSAGNNKENIFKKYSPIEYVKENEPNTLIVHSKKDSMVPYENSSRLYEKLKETNNKVEMLSLEEGDHDLSGINQKEVVNLSIKMLNFIIKNTPL
jgi:triacylglycerol lipase